MKKYLTHEDLFKRASILRGGKRDLPCDYTVRHKIIIDIGVRSHEPNIFHEFSHHVRGRRDERNIPVGLIYEDSIVTFKRDAEGCIIKLESRLDPSYICYSYMLNDDIVFKRYSNKWVKDQKDRSPIPFGDIMDLNFPNLTHFKCVGKVREWNCNIIFELDDPITDEEYALIVESAKETHHGN